MKQVEEGGTANEETGVSGWGQAVRGQNTRDVAARAMRRGGRHAGDVHALQGYGDLSQRLAGIGR